MFCWCLYLVWGYCDEWFDVMWLDVDIQCVGGVGCVWNCYFFGFYVVGVWCSVFVVFVVVGGCVLVDVGCVCRSYELIVCDVV